MDDDSCKTSVSIDGALHREKAFALPGSAGAPVPEREAALREILQLMEHWQVEPGELVDPAERQAALGNARRMVAFWRITPEELDGPLLPTPTPPPLYRYTHPVTGETWDGRGRQPEWLRRCLISEGYRVDEVRTPFSGAN